MRAKMCAGNAKPRKDMGDFDDMNATPLGKLPMPAVQSKGDGPRVDMTPSYSEILEQMKKPPQQEVPQAPQAPQQLAGNPLAGNPLADFQQQHFPQQHPSAAMGPPPRQRPPRHYMPPPRRRPEPAPLRRSKHTGGGGVKSVLRTYKSSILVACTVLAVLMYVAPKLAQTVPQLLAPTGKFNTVGLLMLAIMCGGIHRVADRYVSF